MLVLTRRAGESIVIGDEVRVVVLDVRGDTVRLGIEAPRNVQVHRAEVYAEVQAANAAAVSHSGDLESLAGRLARIARPARPGRGNVRSGAHGAGVPGARGEGVPGARGTDRTSEAMTGAASPSPGPSDESMGIDESAGIQDGQASDGVTAGGSAAAPDPASDSSASAASAPGSAPVPGPVVPRPVPRPPSSSPASRLTPHPPRSADQA
jgi:carbon storage regulator